MDYRKYDERLRSKTEAYFGQFNDHITHACTLTFKQDVNGKQITAEQAWVYFENYCKYLNRTIYIKPKRYKKTLLILPILHGELKNINLHFHCAIGCTDRDYSFDKLKAVINSTWREMKWTTNITEIKPYRDTGWIKYMCDECVRLDLNTVNTNCWFIPKELKAEILG